MEYKVIDGTLLQDGAHVGVVINVENRDEPFDYTDLIIECEGRELSVGYSSKHLSTESKLGKLFQRFGFDLKPGNIISDDVFIGKKVTFLTMQKESLSSKYKGKKFIHIIPETVKPAD